MAQVLTLISVAALISYLVWRYSDRLRDLSGTHILLQLHRAAPGANLVWHIRNTSPQPISVTKLIIHGPQGVTDVAARGLPAELAPGSHVVAFTDVDWSLLTARQIAIVDTADHEHTASHRQLAAIQARLRLLIDRGASTTSAHDFITGAADFAVGVVILGLGFFMLMWIIATG
jgi:hypothetical protein